MTFPGVAVWSCEGSMLHSIGDDRAWYSAGLRLGQGCGDRGSQSWMLWLRSGRCSCVKRSMLT
jgi:hypothetical protein